MRGQGRSPLIREAAQTAQISSKSSAKPSASSPPSSRLAFSSRSAIPDWPARQISTARSWGRLDAP